MAGFGAYYHFGPFGTDGVSLAGRLYAWVGGNDEGNDGSGYWIGKGIEDAQAERADYWKDFIEGFPPMNEPWRFH